MKPMSPKHSNKRSRSIASSNKKPYRLLWLISLTLLTTNSYSQDTNSRFVQLKNKLFNEPYSELPQYKVKRQLFGSAKNETENKLLDAARRTFSSTEDLITLPTKQKLLNANGICFVGTWRITQDSEYTGLYQNGSLAPAIIRASVAFSGTKQKNKRAFGMAIKLLPDDLKQQASLNAFVLHSMGGAITKNVLDLPLDNEPPLGRLPKFSDLSTALRLRRDLEKADKENGATKADASFRPVNVFAEYKVDQRDVVSPRWLKLTALNPERVDHLDFRDELRVEHYSNKKISYQISAAGNNQDKISKKKSAEWKNIGILDMTESVTSESCDINLHFQHSKLD